MALRVVGAGLPRTGTLSLKTALERLLGAPCYHMSELFEHPEHLPVWADAFDGTPVGWAELFDGYAAAVDAPAALMWRQIAAAFPEAIVVLSTRESAEKWWASMDKTIFPRVRERQVTLSGAEPDDVPPERRDMMRMFRGMAAGFGQYADDKPGAMAWYEQYNAQVHAEVPTDRLVEWQAADGWGPLCAALGVPIPDEPFPRVNSTEDFQNSFGAVAPEDLFARHPDEA